MKSALPLLVPLVLVLAACDTIENQRSLYSPAKGDGPYTRSLRDGTWQDRSSRSVDEEYAEAQRQKGKKGAAPAPVVPAAKPAAPEAAPAAQ